MPLSHRSPPPKSSSSAAAHSPNAPPMSGERGAARGPRSQLRGRGARQVGTSRDEEGEYGPHTPAIPPTPPRMADPRVPFANIVARGKPSSPGRDAQLKEKFRHFLDNHGKKEGGTSLYKLMAEFQARQGLEHTILVLNFDNLLKDKQYVDLAIEITRVAIKSPEHSWLQPTARDFLNTWFNLEGNMKQLLGFRFLNEAKSVKPLSEYKNSDLVKKQSVYGGAHQVWKISHKGRHVYLAVLNYTLAVHRSRKSWNGEFNMADIYIVEYNRSKMECLIYANTRDLNENDYYKKVRDLQMINTLVTPKYQAGDEYPPYVVDLKADFEQLTCSKLRDTGFVLSLPFHLALMSPAARCFLLSKLHLVTQMRSVQGGIDFSSIFDKMVRKDNPDWRPEYKRSKDPVLQGVYTHNNRGGEDKFSDNLKGMFKYKRHLVQHAHQHLPKHVKVIHADESELFAASKLPLVLPIIVNNLFSGTSMKFVKELGSVWSDYCKMCYNDDEDNVTIPSSEMPSVFLQDDISV